VSAAQATLASAYRAGERLVQLYTEQMFQARHQRQPRLDTTLGCRLSAAALSKAQEEALMQSCNSVSLPFDWKEIEVEEGSYRWEQYDQLLDWAERQGLSISAGPLVTFTRAQLPEWIWIWERDLSSLASFMSEYVGAVVRRYRNRIRAWQLCAASNCANVLGLGEDEMLWLTVKLAESARQIDPNLALVAGVSQPWGDYMAAEDRTHSPFIFADTLIRSGLNLAALDLELVTAASPQGSFSRDVLEASRLIDLYTLLGIPLRVTLACPAAPAAKANPDAGGHEVGYWKRPFTPEVQAEWASQFTALALCKPSVKTVLWAQLSDAAPNHFPQCGLFDAQGNPRPVLKTLHELRENHLR
jgi:glycosyl hydrolase family 10